MSHTNYPDSLDLQSAQFVFQTIKEKTIVENKVKFSYSLWNLTGFLLRTVVGIPEDHTETYADTHTAQAPFSHEEESVLQNLCNECSDMMAEPISLSDPDPIAGFDISSLLALIPIILQLLAALGISFKSGNRGETPGPSEGPAK